MLYTPPVRRDYLKCEINLKLQLKENSCLFCHDCKSPLGKVIFSEGPENQVRWKEVGNWSLTNQEKWTSFHFWGTEKENVGCKQNDQVVHLLLASFQCIVQGQNTPVPPVVRKALMTVAVSLFRVTVELERSFLQFVSKNFLLHLKNEKQMTGPWFLPHLGHPRA